MRALLLAVSLLLFTTIFAQNDPYQKAWQALNENKRSLAKELLQEAMAAPATFEDAYITHLYLKAYDGKEGEVTDFDKNFFKKAANPYPHTYALWFNKAVMGSYGKKSLDHQTRLMELLLEDEKAPGTLVAAANYHKGMDALFSANFNKMQRYFDAVGNIRNWQYTGPFENISGSGIYKEFGPLAHPEPSATFTSSSNADVSWFTPSEEIKDGWTPVSYQFNRSTAVVYAQNFVTAANNEVVYCNVGFSGSIKIWINDKLVIEETKELVTEMDAITVKTNLVKGVNRVLIQLGFTDNSYPNFSLRFTDANYKVIPGVSGSATYAAYPKATTEAVTEIPQFAEAYFLDKIAKQPDNFVWYMLLTDVYLRSKKVIEARNLIDVAIKKAPNNSLLRMRLVEILIKENNRTVLLEEIEKIKQADPESLVVLDLNIKEFFDNEKYEDGAKELERRISLHGEDESTYGYKILLLIHEKKYEELVKVAEKMYKLYPNNTKMIELMYTIKKEVYKDNKGAMKVYESYMKDNYDYDVYSNYARILAEKGSDDKSVAIKKMITETFPYSPSGFYDLSKQYFTSKEYAKAESLVRKALSLSPYNENYQEHLGDIKNEQKNTAEALSAYNQSLKFDPNQYTILNKIRKLNGKPEMIKLFPDTDVNALIKSDDPAKAKNTDYGYYFILDQKNAVLYPGGATEEFYTVIIKITNEKGVDNYKQSNIGYSSGSQSLLIEKAEVIKKNQSRIEGERNGNEVVFTNLEVGDVVVFQYRIQHYSYGRFAKELWDKFYFGGQIYAATTRYSLMLPASQKLTYTFNNSNVKPVIKDVEDFKQYTWEINELEPLKNEPLMPLMVDISAVLHVSTVSSWQEIANWYSDICNNKAEQDFEIIALYKKLFPDTQKGLTEFQKAKIIYEYIESNIRYSSVSFRQSALVPQRASATLTTRLGDCKDLSSLFVTLAHMAGINAQMVLVDTRDNGQKEILLPSMEFNHCIVKAVLDKKDYFIELTDNDLPFASLPNNLNGALVLEIPSRNMAIKSELKYLQASTRTRDVIRRVIDIKPVDSDLNISVKTSKQGHLSSGVRSNYRTMDDEKQLQEMEKVVAKSYKNNIKMQEVKFLELDKLNDSVSYSYAYKVKNEVSEIGSLNTFKVIYPDVVATLDNFSADTRLYPIQYWSYEDTDVYETTVNVTVAPTQKFIELPASETLVFGDIKYSLQYSLKAPNKLVIVRKFSNSRQQVIAPEDYEKFKTFFEKIVKAEQKFIAYK